MKKVLLLSGLLCLGLATSARTTRTFDPPMMGWSSWNTFAFNINEDVFKAQADAMVANGMKDAGYRFINMDSGFWNGRAEDGTLQISPTQFPHGLRYVTDYIHSLGLMAGFYSDGGSAVCGNGSPQHTGVGLYQHEEEDLRLCFVDWNYDFIKVDYCGGWGVGLEPEEQFSKISRIMHRLKPDARFNITSGLFPGTWAHRVATSARTSMDIELSWKSLRSLIFWNLNLQAFTRGGFYNDFDMLEIGRTLTPDEENTHMAYWCICSSPLIAGCDLTKVNERSLQLMTNRDLLAMNQDVLGIGAPLVQRDGDVFVVAKDMEKRNGNKRAVVVMNLTDEVKTMDVDLALLGFGGDVQLYDCFTHQNLPNKVRGTFKATIPAHGSRAYFATGKRIEKRLYQAEEAWLEGYQMVKRQPCIIVRPSESASLGYYVGNVGNSPKEYLEWDNVYSKRGGRYCLTIRYASGEQNDLVVWLNGEKVHVFPKLCTTSWENWHTVSLEVKLKKGENTVRLGNDEAPAPNIDLMEVSPVK